MLTGRLQVVWGSSQEWRERDFRKTSSQKGTTFFWCNVLCALGIVMQISAKTNTEVRMGWLFYDVNAFRCKPMDLLQFYISKGLEEIFLGLWDLPSCYAKLVCLSPPEHLLLPLYSLKAINAFKNLVMSFRLTVKAASVVYHKKRQWDVIDVVSLTKDFSFCGVVYHLFG